MPMATTRETVMIGNVGRLISEIGTGNSISLGAKVDWLSSLNQATSWSPSRPRWLA